MPAIRHAHTRTIQVSTCAMSSAKMQEDVLHLYAAVMPGNDESPCIQAGHA